MPPPKKPHVILGNNKTATNIKIVGWLKFF